MTDAISKIQSELSRSQYIKPLFDPVQTHAVYGVSVECVEHTKHMLRTHKATRFRVVKAGITGQAIVCFKLPK